MEETAFKHALQNAALHGGKADAKAVLGKILSENPELRGRLAEVRDAVEKAVERVNKMPPGEQEKGLGNFEFKKTERKEGLPELRNAKKGKVVTRFAPAPTGPLNILHVLRAAGINFLYARKYGGKFLLRFEDTDPRNIEKAFYQMVREDLEGLEMKPDKEFIQSEYMELYCKKAELLLEKGKAYVCFCDAKDFQLLKQEKKDCPCRWNRPDKNVLGWKGMLSGRYSEGKAVLRLLTSMQDSNPAFRDPPLMRIVEGEHPLQGKKHRVWPLYNFANALMDDFCGVTHVFRGKEHEHNTWIQQRICSALGLKLPGVLNFGMMRLSEDGNKSGASLGGGMHTRDIKKGIQEGRFAGWDDLKLPTVRAFLRRGFVPQAFREFAAVCGLSKTDISIDLGNLEAINRKIIDPEASRYMFVAEPKGVDVSGILEKTGLGGFVRVKNHPEREETREVSVTGKLWVSGEDFKRFSEREVRLIDLFNVVLGEECRLAKSQEFGMKTPKIQWVSEKNVPVKILMPGKEVSGLGEEAIKKLKIGEIVQLLRVGFCRVEKPGVLVFGHK